MSRVIRIATRQSDLALWQAEHVADLLRKLEGVGEVILVPMVTRGDQILDRALNKIGGKGLFIKELEHAMQRGEADLAVHSMKDVPAKMPEGFCIAGVLDRADPRDAMVGSTLDELRSGDVVGTSSLRRAAQLRMLRDDLTIKPLRGNVNTRLKKLDDGHYDAIVLACAGLHRLGFATRISEALAPSRMLPAVGQGIVGIECKEDDAPLIDLITQLDDELSRDCIAAERAVAHVLGATCHSPLGVHAHVENGRLLLQALLVSADGRDCLQESREGERDEGAKLGADIATSLLARGGAALLEQEL